MLNRRMGQILAFSSTQEQNKLNSFAAQMHFNKHLYMIASGLFS